MENNDNNSYGTAGTISTAGTAASDEAPSLNFEQENIKEWLKKLHFKKKVFGGVSELDVWKKLDQLNSMYNASIAAERARYDALLERSRIEKEETNRNGGEE